MQKILPSWIKKRLIVNEESLKVKRRLSEFALNTVCESSLCPNMNECFSRRSLTILVLGKICTRACGFCAVRRDTPEGIDHKEPERIAEFLNALRLNYIVITSVTRDDLSDGGASQFVRVIEAIRNGTRGVRMELLVPDFAGNEKAIKYVAASKPDILGHNIEAARRIYPAARQGADYDRSLTLLKVVKDMNASQLTKSGIMVGLGETEEEVIDTMRDLRRVGCDIFTVGQYLSPGNDNLPVERFVAPDEFARYGAIGKRLGFKSVNSGPFVRSSYLAEKAYSALRECNGPAR